MLCEIKRYKKNFVPFFLGKQTFINRGLHLLIAIFKRKKRGEEDQVPRVPGSGDTIALFSNIISSASSNHVV